MWGRGDSVADERLLAADYVDHTPPPGITPDRAGHRENLRIFHTAFPDMRFTIDDLVAEGQICEVWHQQDVFGMLRQLGVIAFPQAEHHEGS